MKRGVRVFELGRAETVTGFGVWYNAITGMWTMRNGASYTGRVSL